jgi:iron(III) transport system ATP-binding protein
MKELRFQHISRSFGGRIGVHDVNLTIHAGEFFSLLGPSGSGKSTLLRIVAGLEKPDDGSVWLDDRDITPFSPQKRHCGMVFQNYALFPHMTVGENVAFGLHMQEMSATEIALRTRMVLGRVALSDREHASVGTLSGGEQQRVAVARAIVIEPDVLLFDEPLSNLDVTLRERTRAEIRALQKRTSITTVYVTHDQAEALSISDRIAIINEGHIEQVGTPTELYRTPASAFVARFLGWENTLPGVLDEVKRRVKLTDIQALLPGTFRNISAGPVMAYLPPEAIRVTPPGKAGTHAGTIENVEFRGGSYRLTLRLRSLSLQSDVVGDNAKLPWSEGQRVGIAFDWHASKVFPLDPQ